MDVAQPEEFDVPVTGGPLRVCRWPKVNTGNLGRLRPVDPFGFGGADDGDGWRWRRMARGGLLGAFEWPAGDFSFDDAGVGSSSSWWEQAVQEFSQRGLDGPGESAGGKMPPGR